MLDSLITFPVWYYQNNISIFNENFINHLFSLQYHVENSSFHLNIINEKLTKILTKNCLFSLQYNIKTFIFTYSYHIRKFRAHKRHSQEDSFCFLRFLFEGNFRKYDISVLRKHTKTNKNMMFSVLLRKFPETRILCLMQCYYFQK